MIWYLNQQNINFRIDDDVRIAIRGELMLHCEKLIGARWDKSNSPVQLVQAFALFQLDSSGGGDNKGYQDSREICRIKCSMLQLFFCGIKISPSSNHDRYYKILPAWIEKAGWVEVAWGPSGPESHRTPHSPDLAPGALVIWIYIDVVVGRYGPNPNFFRGEQEFGTHIHTGVYEIVFCGTFILIKNSSNFRRNSSFESILEKKLPLSVYFRKNSPFQLIL